LKEENKKPRPSAGAFKGKKIRKRYTSLMKRHSGAGKKYLQPTTTTNGVKPVAPDMPYL
jgi:hypothetical protein